MKKRAHPRPTIGLLASSTFLILLLAFSGCMGTAGKALESHEKGVSKVFEDEYIVPKKPVDRAYIGCAWSRQFGPVEDPSPPEIRIRKERSLNNIQQEYAYSLGIALGDAKGAQAIDPATGQVLVQAGGSLEAGAKKGRLEQARMEGVEINSNATASWCSTTTRWNTGCPRRRSSRGGPPFRSRPVRRHRLRRPPRGGVSRAAEAAPQTALGDRGA